MTTDKAMSFEDAVSGYAAACIRYGHGCGGASDEMVEARGEVDRIHQADIQKAVLKERERVDEALEAMYDFASDGATPMTGCASHAPWKVTGCNHCDNATREERDHRVRMVRVIPRIRATLREIVTQTTTNKEKEDAAR